MLWDFYLFLAVVGGTVFAIQFVMNLFALGGHGIGHHYTHVSTAPADSQSSGHTPELQNQSQNTTDGSDSHSPMSHAVATHAAHGHTVATRVPHPAGSHGPSQTTHFASHVGHFFLAMLSLQPLVAGATAFGLAGLAADASHFWAIASLAAATVVAFLVMAMVVSMLRSMERMEDDGTVHLDQAVGKIATVYLSIPAEHAGVGKIMVNVQDRSMELPAYTLQSTPISIGEKVVVVGMESPNIAQVMPTDRIPGLEVKL